jgi:hypothetical protein
VVFCRVIGLEDIETGIEDIFLFTIILSDFIAFPVCILYVQGLSEISQGVFERY